MKQFTIETPNKEIVQALRDKVDNLTKPKGSLGKLESLAVKIGWIQQTLSPELKQPHNILFAADHGIVEENVSKSPKSITWQQVIHFTQGGAGINFLCDQHNFTLDLIDAGVDYDFTDYPKVKNMKVRKGTNSFLKEAAMSEEEMNLCIERGAQVVKEIHEKGSNVVSFGEMGIANTSPSSIWMSYFTNTPLVECVGAGSGLNNAEIKHKYQVLHQAMENYSGDHSPKDIIRYFGGFEMVMAIGGMLQAAELNMLVLVDGFIMTNCVLAASKLYPKVLEFAIFGHQGDEVGHKIALDYLDADPILHLGLRLGEGSGAICAYPILQSAVKMINDMDSFHAASVTKYF